MHTTGDIPPTSILRHLKQSRFEYESRNVFQQDNAVFHRAAVVQDFLKGHGILTLEWRPHSPDLKPIENAHLQSLSPGGKLDWARIKNATAGSWDALDQGVIDGIIGSMSHDA